MTKPIDLDALLADAEEDGEPVATAPIIVSGEQFEIRKDVNAFQLARLSDADQTASALTQILVRAVAEEDRQRFIDALGRIPRLTIPKLMQLFDAVVGVASDGVPTRSSPVSRRTTPKKVATRRSAAR